MNKPFAVLLSPFSMLTGLFFGVMIGIFQPKWVPYIAPFGEIYLTILKMCIAPILLTAISLNIGRLIQSSLGEVYLKKIVLIMVSLLFIVSLVGLTSAMLFKPGSELGADTLKKLGSIINQSNYAPDLEVEFSKTYTLKKDSPSNVMKFIANLIPDNIFKALSAGMNMEILFFAILFGIGVGNLDKEKSSPFFVNVEAAYLAITKIVNWLMYLLPFGLAGLLASQFASIGIDILFAMTKFTIIMIATYVSVFATGSIIIAYYTQKSLWEVIKIIEKPVLIALGTQSSLACIPSTIACMIQGFNLNTQLSGLLVPLGITVFRFGNVLYFAVASVFVIQLYQIDLSIGNLFIVFLGSIFAGIATAGTSGILTLSMLAMVLEPMGLPLDAVLVLFIVVDPIIDPFRTLCIVHTNMLGTVLVIKDKNEIINDNETLVYE
jgi:proton glutamate symport protein